VSFAEQAEARLATIHQPPSGLQDAMPIMEMQLPPRVTTSQAIPNLLPANSFTDSNSTLLSNAVLQHENLALDANVQLLAHDINDNDWYLMTI
jgi:hypothetical protein